MLLDVDDEAAADEAAAAAAAAAAVFLLGFVDIVSEIGVDTVSLRCTRLSRVCGHVRSTTSRSPVETALARH
jgi:hypothetical protein